MPPKASRRIVNGSAYLIDIRYRSTMEILFGFPNASMKPFNYILRDGEWNKDKSPVPMTRSILLSLDLPILSTAALTVFSLKKFIRNSEPLIFRLYQNPKYVRPHIKFIGTGDIVLKEIPYPKSAFEFTWEPKKLTLASDEQAIAMDYLVSNNLIFKDALPYNEYSDIPSDCVSLLYLYGEIPEINLAYGTYKVYQKIKIALENVKHEKTLKKLKEFIKNKHYEEDDDAEEI